MDTTTGCAALEPHPLFGLQVLASQSDYWIVDYSTFDGMLRIWANHASMHPPCINSAMQHL